MGKIAYGMGETVTLLLAPIDKTTSTEVNSAVVNVEGANWVTFFCYFGVVTSDSTNYGTLCINETTACDTVSAVAIPFHYRLSPATGGDSWGDVTSCASSGLVVVGHAIDGMCYMIDVDPASMDDGYKYLHVSWGLESDPSAQLVAMWAVIDPRYPQEAQLSTSA